MKLNIRISLYWKCQVLGWAIVSVYWGYTAFTQVGHFNLQQGIADFILDVSIGILITHLYRNFSRAKKWQLLHLSDLIWRITLAMLVLSVCYMFFIVSKLYLIRLLLHPYFNVPFSTFFSLNGLTVFITGTRLMSIWLLAYHLYHYATREINIAKENARLALITKDAQLSKLSAQLNPHFFFNSLANIKYLIKENPQNARRAIDLLSELLRNSLYNKEDKLITLEKEISLVEDYLELEKLRFEERLDANIIVAENISLICVPPLSIQTVVENAIKHGIEKSKCGGCIKLHILKESGFIKITVENPGILYGQSKSTGLGLKNLEERLTLQYNGKATFSITQLSKEKVLTTILIPYV